VEESKERAGGRCRKIVGRRAKEMEGGGSGKRARIATNFFVKQQSRAFEADAGVQKPAKRGRPSAPSAACRPAKRVSANSLRAQNVVHVLSSFVPLSPRARFVLWVRRIWSNYVATRFVATLCVTRCDPVQTASLLIGSPIPNIGSQTLAVKYQTLEIRTV